MRFDLDILEIMQAGANFFATVKPIVYMFVGSAIGGFILKLILDAIMRKR